MTRGEKRLSVEFAGRTFAYSLPGWWCSLDDPDDVEGQLVDGDNVVAELAQKIIEARKKGDTAFLLQVLVDQKLLSKEAAEQLAELARKRPDLFRKPTSFRGLPASDDDRKLIEQAMREARARRFYGPLLADFAD